MRRGVARARWRAAGVACGVALTAILAPVGGEEPEEERIVRLLRLAPGQVVADVGAGSGEWAVKLARRVGERGRVYATEVTEDLLAALSDRVARADGGRIVVVRGEARSSGLPPGCCNALLLRLVYHHFTDPGAMRADLSRALRPGGRILLIETRPQAAWRELPEVPDRGGHGIPLDELLAEWASDGFVEVTRREAWGGDPERFAVLLERGPDALGR